MVLEIVFTIGIVGSAIYIVYKNLKKSASGKCNCGSCSTSCPKYQIENEKNRSKQ